MEDCRQGLQSQKEMTPWKPSQTDIDWVSNLVRILTDNAVWSIPGNGNVYRLSKSRKRLILIHGTPDDETHERNKIVFGSIGYAVLDSDAQDVETDLLTS